MAPIPEPVDGFGNVIYKDNLVVLDLGRPIVFKVISIEKGGIHTPQGITPTKLRLVADLNLATIPGMPFIQLIRIVSPSEEAVANILGGLPPRG